MASAILTKIDGWSNFFFTLLGVPGLFLSHGEVGGRCFWFGAPPLPAEDINPLERVAHAANASTIRSVHTTDFSTFSVLSQLALLRISDILAQVCHYFRSSPACQT